MSTMAALWKSGFPVKADQVIPGGTEYMTGYFISTHGLCSLTYDTASADLIVTKADESEIRTIEPLPDPNDTGDLSLDSGVARGSGQRWYQITDGNSGYDMTEAQLRNLARKITEALDV